MNTFRHISLSVAVGVALTANSSLMGQVTTDPDFLFDIPGVDGGTNTTFDVSASGEIYFEEVLGDSGSTAVQVIMDNTSAIEAWLTTFAVLEPAFTGVDSSQISFGLQQAQVGTVDDGFIIKDWNEKYSDVVNGNLKKIYFGAGSEQNPSWNGIGSGQTGIFDFLINQPFADIDLSVYDDDELAHVTVHWQALPDGSSAKGYTFVYADTIVVNPVPEPAHFAILGLLTMAGLLVWRRKKA
ncbi:MAG: PEP-CTERM sorting domain-containing protein [Puniceicoccaceae bacterium]